MEVELDSRRIPIWTTDIPDSHGLPTHLCTRRRVMGAQRNCSAFSSVLNSCAVSSTGYEMHLFGVSTRRRITTDSNLYEDAVLREWWAGVTEDASFAGLVSHSMLMLLGRHNRESLNTTDRGSVAWGGVVW